MRSTLRRALIDRAGLADLVVVQPDEVGPLAADVGEQHFVADEAVAVAAVTISSKYAWSSPWLMLKLFTVMPCPRRPRRLEQAGRPGVAGADHLVGLALAAVGRAHHRQAVRVADPLRFRQNVAEMPR